MYGLLACQASPQEDEEMSALKSLAYKKGIIIEEKLNSSHSNRHAARGVRRFHAQTSGNSASRSTLQGGTSNSAHISDDDDAPIFNHN